MRKIYLFSLVLLILLVGQASAYQESMEKPWAVDECKDLKQTSYACDTIIMDSISHPNGSITYPNIAMNKSGSTFTYEYCATSGIGEGSFNAVCAAYNVSAPVRFEVTPNGEVYNTQSTIVQIFLILFFVGLMWCFYTVSSKVDYESWHKKIQSKYDEKNSPKVIVSSMAMVLLKDTFLIYYLLGWPILLLARSMIRSFGISSVSGIFDAMGIFYTAGLLIVIVLFWGRLQEFIMDIFDKSNLKEWGI